LRQALLPRVGINANLNAGLYDATTKFYIDVLSMRVIDESGRARRCPKTDIRNLGPEIASETAAPSAFAVRIVASETAVLMNDRRHPQTQYATWTADFYGRQRRLRKIAQLPAQIIYDLRISL